MILYVFEQYRGNKTSEQNTEQLVALAIKQYAKETGFLHSESDAAFRLCKTQKGKPYIEGYPLYISVSHSDFMWVCLIGEQENGVDIQKRTHTNFEAIAKRFYQPEEQKAVAEGGIASFIAIWCRKESFIKLFGFTIGDTIDWLNVAENKAPANQIYYMDRIIMFSEIDFHPEYICVAAIEKKEEIWIRRILTA